MGPVESYNHEITVTSQALENSLIPPVHYTLLIFTIETCAVSGKKLLIILIVVLVKMSN